ncbi:MAG: hypothetical protein Q8880_10790, partial [Bacteroidota bacterium]|nr:hypothetical protein [Bacteroidota bacterium]
IKQISGVSSISNLMAFCIQHNYNSILFNKLVDSLNNFSECIPIFEFGFVPDYTAINYLIDYEQKY